MVKIWAMNEIPRQLSKVLLIPAHLTMNIKFPKYFYLFPPYMLLIILIPWWITQICGHLNASAPMYTWSLVRPSYPHLMAPLPLHPWHPHYEDLLCLFMIIWSGYKEGDNPTPEEGSQPKCPLGLSLVLAGGGGRLCFLLIFTPLLIKTTLFKQCDLL